MNLKTHTLAAVLGASVASLATYLLAPRPLPAVPPPPLVNRTVAAGPVSAGSGSGDVAELERLTRENTALKAELEEARTRLVQHDATLKLATDQLEELRRPMVADLLSSTLRAELKSGEVVVTGGYKLADGRRLYAFAKPVIQKVAGKDTVMIEGRYLTLTDEAGRSVGLDNLATNAANTLQHGEVWVPAEEEAVLAKLQATAGVDLAQYPGVSVEPGRSGVIIIGNTQLKVTPTLAEAGDGLGLELRLEQPQ